MSRLRRREWIATAVATAAAAVATFVLLVVLVHPGRPDSPARPGPGDPAATTSPAGPPGHVASVPLAGRTGATLEVESGTPVLQVRVGPVSGALVQASTPAGAPVRPVLSGSGTGPFVLSLASVPSSGSASYAVTVVLNPAVTWTLNFGGGAQQVAADLRGGRIAGIIATAGVTTLDATLPRPAGTLTLRMEGGVTTFAVRLPGGVPAQVTAGGGASEVTIDGQRHDNLSGGTVLTPPGWAAATSRFALDATAGFTTLTISRW